MDRRISTLAFGFGLGACLSVFAAAPAAFREHADFARSSAAIVGLILVVFHTFDADEVQRRLALRASSWAFFVCLALALLVLLLSTPETFVLRDYAWALMMSAWLAAWIILRARQS